jgi:hypothetical protein
MVLLGVAACGGSEKVPQPAVRPATAVTETRPRGVVEDCSTRSEAAFPGAFTDEANVVVGPLVLVGAAFTGADTIREFGGNKFPALVRAGHRVTVALPADMRGLAGLGYGPLPQGVELSPEDGHRAVTFIACPLWASSGSVTFWSGAVLARAPRCVPLAVWVDGEPAPRRVALRMGIRECP